MERLPLRPLGSSERYASAYLAGLAPRSQLAMRRALVRCAVLVARFPTKDGRPIARIDLDRCPWRDLTPEHLACLRAELSNTSSPASVRQALCAVRSVLALAGALDATKMAATRVAAPRRPTRAFTPVGHARDDAIRALRASGMTLPAILKLDVSAWRAGATRVVVESRPRRVPDELGDYLDRWLDVRGGAPGRLFCGLSTRGRPLPDRPMDVRQPRKRLGPDGTKPPPSVAALFASLDV